MLYYNQKEGKKTDKTGKEEKMSVMFVNERTAQRTSHRAIAIDWYKSGDNITAYNWDTTTKKWQFSIGWVHA